MPRLPLSPIRTGGKPARSSSLRLEVGGLAFDVHRSDRRKSLQITVERSGELLIFAPTEVQNQDLIDFVQKNLVWVHTKIGEKARLQQKAPIKEFVDGEGFLYLGKSYRLRLVDKQLANLSLKSGRFFMRRSLVHRGRETFISWYTCQARLWFEKQAMEHAIRMGVKVKEVKVQDLGFRWGSFGSDGRVFFHWKSILLPPRIAQYVVVHELAHAHQPDHSESFWMLVEQNLPDWRSRKTWLAENGIQVEGL